MARRVVGETKKHLARAERERIQRRWILIGTISIVMLLVVILAYGIYDTNFVQPYKTVAEVNGETITAGIFEGRVRLIQRELLSQLTSYLQMETFFGSDPDILQEIRNLQLQIETQLANPELLGRDVLESMILQTLLTVQAQQQGVSVSEAELETEVQRNFFYFPNGTPTSAPTFTPLATMTLDPEMVEAFTPTASPSPGPSPTTPPATPVPPTATPYTLDAYQLDYREFIDSLDDFRISEDDFLAFIEIGILEQKMRETYVADVDREEEQVFARIILTENEDVANEALERLEAGETWEELALELSLDPATNTVGGEIGWSTVSELIARYGQQGLAAFAAPDGEVLGPFTVESGEAYLFTVEAREVRPISEAAYQRAVEGAFDAWLQGLRDEAEVIIAEDWQQYLPPAVPLTR